jgi:hypothetical protein
VRIEQRISQALNREVTRRKFLDIVVFGAADAALGAAAWQGYKAAKAGSDADNAENRAKLVGQEVTVDPNIYYSSVAPGYRLPVVRRPALEAAPTPTPISPERREEINRDRQELRYQAQIHSENYYKHAVLAVLFTALGVLIGGPRYLKKDE